MDCTSKDALGMFKHNKLRPQAFSEGNVLAKQALSWTVLNLKENFRAFVRQGNLSQEGSIIEIFA